MSWQPTYQALFTKAIKWQMLAILNRDMQSALDWVSGAPGSLQTFVHWHTATIALEQFPSLLLATVDRADDPERGPAERSYTARFYAALAVAHQNPSVVADMCEDYARAFDAVLTTSWEQTTTDFYTPLPLPAELYGGGIMTPGLEAGSLRQMRIGGAVFSDARQRREGKGFAQAAVINMEFEMTET